MYSLVLLLQLVVPAGLLLWLGLAPSRHAVVFWVQALGTSLLLLALALAGLWLVLPWWVAYSYCALWLLLVLRGVRQRRKPERPRPVRAGRVARVALFGAVALFSGRQLVQAWHGRRLPAASPMVDLQFPLPAGRYLVVSGGSTLALNPHTDALDTTVAQHRTWHGTGYGLDLVALDRWGRRAQGLLPTDPAAYFIFGTPVLAPSAGTVLLAEDGHPDQPIPHRQPASLTGNYLVLRGAQADVVLAHFRRGSLRVRPGQRVRTGQVLAQAGNSGLSDEPHLHIHAQRPGPPGAPFSGQPLPLRFQGRFLVRNDRVIVPAQPAYVLGISSTAPFL